SVFLKTRVSRSPEEFFDDGEWVWADSAYGSQTWCVVPFKRPSQGDLTADQKTFNYHLSKVRVRSEHLFGALKGRFQSLKELRFQIQSERQLEYANMWTRCIFILHNMIIKIEEDLDLRSAEEFVNEGID
ncbi:hypothetical protein BV22DRAFT_968194, partial [Leucogyrophana mollusca]